MSPIHADPAARSLPSSAATVPEMHGRAVSGPATIAFCLQVSSGMGLRSRSHTKYLLFQMPASMGSLSVVSGNPPLLLIAGLPPKCLAGTSGSAFFSRTKVAPAINFCRRCRSCDRSHPGCMRLAESLTLNA